MFYLTENKKGPRKRNKKRSDKRQDKVISVHHCACSSSLDRCDINAARYVIKTCFSCNYLALTPVLLVSLIGAHLQVCAIKKYALVHRSSCRGESELSVNL